MIYLITREAIYINCIIGYRDSLKIALDDAKRMAGREPDDHHDIVVTEVCDDAKQVSDSWTGQYQEHKEVARFKKPV